MAAGSAGKQVPEGIILRLFASLEEMRTCEQLQKGVWEFSDLDVVPSSVFVLANKIGGEAFGAFHRGRAIGFTLAFPAFRTSRFFLHSHMAAVLPEYQNQGIGRSLKLAQRERALARDVELIEWTFDPLQLKNAHFNIRRLGVIIRQYVPSLYGRTSSILHANLRTDRLIAEWWLRSDRVRNTLGGTQPQTSRRHKRVSVPESIGQLCRSDPQAASEIQFRVGLEFQHLFQESYAVTGFEFENGHGTYLLEPYED